MTREGLIRVSYFAALEVHGIVSVSNVVDMVRRISGKGIQRADVGRWIAEKLDRELLQYREQTTARTSAGTSRELLIEHEKQFPGTAQRLPSELPLELLADSSRAPHKVLELEELGVCSGDKSPSQPPGAKKAAQLRLDTRTLFESIADEVIAALKPMVAPSLQGMTWADWRLRNRRVLISMAKSDMTAEDILSVYHAESERIGETVRSMRWLQDRLNVQTSSPYAQTVPIKHETRREDTLPTLAELLDSGQIPDWETA